MTRLELVDKLIAWARLARTSDLDEAADFIRHAAGAIAQEQERQAHRIVLLNGRSWDCDCDPPVCKDQAGDVWIERFLFRPGRS